MSVWNDIRQKSLGKETRKEDQIDDSPYATKDYISNKLSKQITYGVVHFENELPKTPQPGMIIYIQSSEKVVLYTGNEWTNITQNFYETDIREY